MQVPVFCGPTILLIRELGLPKRTFGDTQFCGPMVEPILTTTGKEHTNDNFFENVRSPLPSISDIGTPLDNMIGVEDTLVVAYEKNGFDGNTCYVPRYHLSDFSTKKRFGPGLNNYEHGAKANEVFYTRILLNWAIISAPRHPILIRTMENLVEVIRSDFLREPVLRYLKLDYRWRLVMCATGPSMMTASARELVLEQLFARGPNSTSDVMDSGKYS